LSARKGRPKIGKTGCLFWLFIFLVIIVILLYRGKGSFKETFSFIKEKVTQQEEKKEAKEETPPFEIKEPQPESREEPAEKAPVEMKEEGTAPKTPPEQVTQPAAGAADEKSVPPVKQKKADEAPKPKTKHLTATLFYVKINKSDGSAKLVPVSKTISYIDSPITRTMNALLQGPTISEKESGIISFIPEGTTLISAQIHSGHLTLNFSSQFESNYNGRDAILLQLSQVMLTSFDFQQVTKLSMLIGGEKRQYVTGEGIPLKEVYTKQDLSQINTER